jgi:hypothetical protein
VRRGSLVAAALVCAALTAVPGASAALVSQGAVRMGADALWSRGLLGEGQVVAILDQGFAGLDRSIALGELPPRERMTLLALDPAGLDGLTELGVPTQHGVRMAELVHDLAPEAHLVLASYRTLEQFEEAAAWVAARGIPIVSHSNSFLTPPFDGTGRAARAVDAAAASGVLWVNSVGNYAQRHWRGTAPPGGETVIPISPSAGTPLLLALSWTSAAARASVAVERLEATGAWVEVERGVPTGPTAVTLGPRPVEAGAWRVVVRQEAGPPAELRLFSQTVGFGGLAVAGASVPTPGDAAGALSVGAVKWTGATLEPYSSRGPTADGRLKPDLVAPTYVTSNPEWPGTAGTSAAAAHVAGAAALLRQARLAAGDPAGPADLRRVLVATALDLGRTGPDPLYGAGMARLDARRPELRLRVSPGRRPVARLRVRDEGTIRRVLVSLNGRSLRVARRPAVGVRLPPLRPGRNRLWVAAEDMAGNVTTRTRVLRGPRR